MYIKGFIFKKLAPMFVQAGESNFIGWDDRLETGRGHCCCLETEFLLAQETSVFFS